MERRAFLRSTCNICGLLAAGTILPSLLAGCGPAAYQVIHSPIHNDQIDIPLTGFDKSPLQIVRPDGWLYSIAVQRHENNTYTAHLLKCTHQDNQLTVAGNNGYTCSLHGSTFNTEGKVTKGPAERSLRSYSITPGNNTLTINLKS